MYFFAYFVVLFNTDQFNTTSKHYIASSLGITGTVISAMSTVSKSTCTHDFVIIVLTFCSSTMHINFNMYVYIPYTRHITVQSTIL